MALTNKRGKGWIEVEGLGRVSDSDYERMLRQGQIKIVNNDTQNIANMLTGEMMTTGIPQKREIPQEAYDEDETRTSMTAPSSNPLGSTIARLAMKVANDTISRATRQTNPYATSANQSLPNSFYNSRYSSYDYTPEKVESKEEDEYQKGMFGNMSASERDRYADLLGREGVEVAQEYARALGSGSRDDDEWLSNLTYDKVYTAADRANNMNAFEQNEYNKRLNESGRKAADAWQRNYRGGVYDRLSEREANVAAKDSLTNSYIDKAKNEGYELNPNDEEYLKNTGVMGSNLESLADYTYRAAMNAKERATYNYILNTEGKEKAEEYYQKIRKGLMKETTDAHRAQIQDFAKENPVQGALTTVGSVAINALPFKTSEWARQFGHTLTTGEMNEDDLLNNFMTDTSDVGRGTVQQGIDNPVFQFMYGVLTSMADMGASIAVGNVVAGGNPLTRNISPAARELSKKLTLGLMGTNAASSATLEAKRRGLDDGQAVTLGIIAGAAEIITENVSIDAFLDASKNLPRGEFLKYIRNNFLPEASEEMFSDLINDIADAVISVDNSEFKEQVREYVSQGMSYEEAERKALTDKIFNVGMSGLAGGVAGIGMGGIGAIDYLNYANQVTNDYNLKDEVRLNNLINEGLNGEGIGRELSERLQGKIENGENITTAERAGVFSEVTSDRTKQINARIKKEVPSLDEDVRSYIALLYDPSTGVNENEYILEANDAYIAGREGEDIETLPSENLSQKQTEALYELGQQKRQEEINELRLREVSERNDSEDTRGQVQSVEEGSGRNQKRATEIRSGGDREANATVLSQNELDTHAPNVISRHRIVQSSESKDYQLAEKMAKDAGLKLVGVDGYMQYKDPNTDKVSKKGAIIDEDTNTIYVNVTSDEYSPSQYVSHEAYHKEIDSGRVNLKETLNKTREKMGDIQFNRAIEHYASMYEGAYDISPDASDEAKEARVQSIFAEMACDAHAGMNIYAGKVSTMAQEHVDTLNTINENTVYNEDNQSNAPPTEADNKSKESESGESEEDYVKFSTKSERFEDLAKENREIAKEAIKLRERLKKAEGEVKPSNPLRAIESRVKELSTKIKKEYSSTIATSVLNKKIAELGKYVVNECRNPNVSDEEFVATVKAMSVDIASELVRTSEEMISEFPESKDILRRLQRGVSISAEDARDIPDFNDFRRSNRKNVKIVANGISVDSAYQELHEMYPARFPSEVTSPSDQLLRMAEVGEYMQPVKANPFEYYQMDLSAIVEEAANNIMSETMFGQLGRYETYADKQARKQEEIENKYKQQITALKEKEAEDIRSLKKSHREKERLAVSKRRARDLRAKIEKIAKSLSDKLLKPTDKKHITETGKGTEPLRSVVAKVLQCVNLESTFEVTEEGGLKHYKKTEQRYNPETGKTELVNDAPAYATKRTQAFRDLKDTYKKLAQDGVIRNDETLSATNGLIDQIIDFENTPINALGEEDLQKIYDCLRALENTLEEADKLKSMDATVIEKGTKLIKDNENRKQKRTWKLPSINNLLIGMRTPQTFFERLGEVGDEIFSLLRKGQNKQIMNLRTVKEFYQELKKANKLKERVLDKQMHEVKLGGKNHDISTSALMDLYVLSNRPQALDHILDGGIRVRGKDTLFHKGSYEKITGITLDELRWAFSKLTPEQLKVAEKLQEFSAKVLAKMGNEASLAYYGYEKFTDENYWQIVIDETQRKGKDDVGGENLPTSVGHKGLSIPVNPNAKNTIDVMSIFDAFYENAVDMCNYAAFLDVMEDVNRLRNFRYTDENNVSHDVKEIVNRIHGEGGVRYWRKLMSDLANGVHSDTSYFGGMLGKFKAGAVGANLSVIAQQSTAISRAGQYIDHKYLLQGMANPISGSKKAIEYSPLAYWKSEGYFEMNTGPTMKDFLLGSETPLDKVNEKLMIGAQVMDDLAWGGLWNAVEAETKATTDLKAGTEEFYKHVAERFEYIVDRTQVVDGILQRADIMRNSNGLVKMATAFMAEPIKQANQAWTTFQKMIENPNPENRKSFARAVVSMSISGTLCVLMKSVIGALRHRNRDKEFLEDYRSEITGLTGEEKNIGEVLMNLWKGNIIGGIDIFSFVPYIKDYESIFQGYDIKRTDMSVVQDWFDSVTKLIKSLNGGTAGITSALRNNLEQAAKLLGVPASNLERDLVAIINEIFVETKNYSQQYMLLKDKYNIDNTSNRKKFVELLFDAWKDDKMDDFNSILEDMKEHYSVKDIQDTFNTLLKDEQGTDDIKKVEGAVNLRTGDIGKYVAISGEKKAANEKAKEEKKQESEEKKEKEEELDTLYSLWVNGDSRFNSMYNELKSRYGVKDFQDVWDKNLKEEQGVSEVKSLEGRPSFRTGEIGQHVTISDEKKAENLKAAAEKQQQSDEKAEKKAEAENNFINNPTYQKVKSSSVWSKATPAMRKGTEDTIINLMTGNDEDMQMHIDYAKKQGISEDKWLLYHLAIKIVDKPNDNGKMNTYTDAERSEAAQLVGLSLSQIKAVNNAVNNAKKAQNKSTTTTKTKTSTQTSTKTTTKATTKSNNSTAKKVSLLTGK